MASTKLTRTFSGSGTGNRKTWTFSLHGCKKGKVSAESRLVLWSNPDTNQSDGDPAIRLYVFKMNFLRCNYYVAGW